MDAVTVFGTGALGCWLAGRLSARTSARVTVAGSWPEGLAAIARDGIELQDGASVISGRPRVAGPHDPLPPAEAALVVVKSHQTAGLAERAAGAVTAEGRVVTLQNGLGNREALAAAAGARVRSGVVVAGVRLLAPGRVAVVGGSITLEAKDGDPVMARLAALLQAAGIETRLAADIEPEIWRKLAVNCAINPLSALLRLPNGALLDAPGARDTLRAAALEVAAVAGARGIDVGDVAQAVLDVAARTAGNRSSMLQDLDRGARTEIDALCGAVVAEGRRRGVPTPVNEKLWQGVAALEAVAAGARA
jgi:2-dehydropantoate 2-reductase